MSATLTEERGRDLSRQAQYRLVRAERREQGGTRIQHAGTGHHAEDAGPAGRARVAKRHVAARLLVPRADHFELRLVKSVEQTVDLRTGQTEYGIDAVSDQAADNGFTTGTYCHGIVQSLSSINSAGFIDHPIA